MTDRLFNDIRKTNANASIMTIETEEGGVEDDNYMAMIGHSTSEHVGNMKNDAGAMMMWNDLIHMPDGNMYRMVPSWDENDKDPHNMRGHELESLKQRFADQYTPEILEEIFQNEEDRREESGEVECEDALDNEIISYDEWERFPGLWEKMELTSTPRDRALYVGNTSQQFYDEFPTGHPDANKINNFLNMFNRKWDDGLDEKYADWAVDLVNDTNMRGYVKECLIWLVRVISLNNNKANLYAERALKGIDKHWRAEFNKAAARKSMRNPMTGLFVKKEQEWEQMQEDGVNPYSAIKKFGQLLFSNFRDQMTGYHWSRYRRIKNKYIPSVILKGTDINRCGVGDLQKVLRVDQEKARDVFLARPFSSLEEAKYRGYINTRSFGDDEKTDKLVDWIEQHTQTSIDTKNLARMRDVCRILIKMQQDRKGNLSSQQWNQVWKFYRICKNEVLEVVNGDQR